MSHKQLESVLSALRSSYQGLESFSMGVATVLKDRFALHKYIKLRQRHIMTKNNTVRLRYSLSVASMFSVFLIMAMAMPASSNIAFKQSDFLRTSAIQKQAEKRAADQEQASAAAHDITEDFQENISEGIRKAALAIKKPPRPLHKELKIGRGDTIAGVLQSAGLSSQDSYQTVQALSEHVDPRTVKPGQQIKVDFKPGEGDALDYKKVTMKVSPIKEIVITKKDDEFISKVKEEELKPQSYARAAEIETSLYGSAVRAGIPPQVIAEVIRIYSWDIDFQRDIRQGDKIEVLYDTQETKKGDFVQYGDVLYANLSVGGKDIPIYRYEMKDGRVDYFEPDGYSIRKTLMKTPINGARLSSGFGMRKHPVLGYNKMHKGLDFAAPTGTPIYAAGDGVIEFKGRKGGYGNYIKIRHNSKLHTAYAHMHKFGRGMGKGKRVEQGDVIGYVGTTGRSTGPHLHYEVHVDGVQKNPKSVDLPTGEQLTGDEFKRFEGLIGAVRQQYVALSGKLKFANKDDEEKSVYFLR